MKSLNDAKLIVKLAVPVAVLIAVCVGMVSLARNSLATLDANTQEIVDHSARRAILVLQLAVAVDEATIREKNLIIADGADRRVLGDEHAGLEKKATQAVGSLVQLSDTPERRAINEQLRDLTARFFATSRRAVDLGLSDDPKAAMALSSGEGRSSRKALLEALDKRVAANVADLEAEKHRAEEVAADAARTLTVLASAGLLAAFGLLAAIAVYGITRPLGRLVAVLQRMATGEIDAPIPEAKRGDEIGAVGKAVEGIKAMVAQKAAEQAEIKRVADEAAARERKRTMVELADGFEAAVGGIVGMVSSSATELQATAGAMSGTAAETAAQSSAVAAAAEQATSNVQTVAAAAEELGSSVQEIGRQVSGSAELARRAVNEADRTSSL
ncbi:HAMP domain-containing protein, partial [Methylobacterium sp. J-067]|uniref:HAMP domain-containing protein n=1 Tax=Methylobacterium sp. J-067 TaxID=2836648 RepID=UPI001FB98543